MSASRVYARYVARCPAAMRRRFNGFGNTVVRMLFYADIFSIDIDFFANVLVILMTMYG